MPVAAASLLLVAAACGGRQDREGAQRQAAAVVADSPQQRGAPTEVSITSDRPPDTASSSSTTPPKNPPTTIPAAPVGMPIVECPGHLQRGRLPLSPEPGSYRLGDLVGIHDGGPAGAWLVLDGTANGSAPGVLLYGTRDGGSTWTGYCAGGATLVSYVDSRHGWLLPAPTRLGQILRTDDAGRTWADGAMPTGTEGLVLEDVSFIDANLGWAVGIEQFDDNLVRSIVLGTLDGGRHWSVLARPDADELVDVAFGDRLHGWAATQENIVLSTTDGGKTWSARNLLPPGSPDYFRLGGVMAADRDHAWVEGTASDATVKVWATVDGGATWTTTAFPHLTGGLAGPDDSLIRLYGNGTVPGQDRPEIITSADGGITWQHHYLTGGRISYMSFSTPTTGWYAADREWPLDYCVYKTTDGGATWAAFPVDGDPTDCQSAAEVP